MLGGSGQHNQLHDGGKAIEMMLGLKGAEAPAHVLVEARGSSCLFVIISILFTGSYWTSGSSEKAIAGRMHDLQSGGFNQRPVQVCKYELWISKVGS